MKFSEPSFWKLRGALRIAPKEPHGEHRVAANNREEQGAEQWEPVWWVFYLLVRTGGCLMLPLGKSPVVLVTPWIQVVVE